mmetsp:Transcript_4807/g.13128  ORF Transcript_4807/g.13128 Transcript_4807/m.13128 type:complete len:214 (+) Transcript_4807:1427-2068(+)
MQLRATLGMMREEMETLQQAAAAAAAAAAVSNGGTPGSGEGGQEARGNNAADSNRAALDVALLRAELQESDKDLQQALHHVEVLQLQLYAPASSSSASPHPLPVPLQAQQQQQQQQQLQQQQQGGGSEHNLVAEDSVSLRGEATASGRPADEPRSTMLAMTPELPSSSAGATAAAAAAARWDRATRECSTSARSQQAGVDTATTTRGANPGSC